MSIGATLGVWISAALGGIDNALTALIFLVLADFIVGWLGALWKGEYESSKCYRGIFKKIFIFVMVTVCHMVDLALDMGFVRDAAIVAYALNEALSIIETLDRLNMGHLIPEPLRKALASVKERKENETK